MIEVADVSAASRRTNSRFTALSMLPSQWRAIEDILNCRTAALGGP